MNRERLKGHLELLLLSVLAAGPAHGYAIITALRARSGGMFDLPEGTVYPALHRLEDAGLLASSWADADGRKRRGDALASDGEAAAAAARARGPDRRLPGRTPGQPAPSPAGAHRGDPRGGRGPPAGIRRGGCRGRDDA